jgi:Flp pilus assembly protein TadG
MRRRLRIRDEHGAVLILIVFLFPLFLLMAVAAVDVANWYVHKRHLQNKADAAALAGAYEMRSTILNAACVPGLIKTKAGDYGGGLNSTFGDSSTEGRTSVLVNEANYKDQSTPNDTDVTGNPCADRVVDVKVSEKNLPYFFDVPTLVPWINAQARVDIRKVTTEAKPLPVAVEDPSAKAMEATFTDESDDSVIGSGALKRVGFSGGLDFWQTPAATPISFNVSQSRIGVKLALSRSLTTTACGDPAVKCYDKVSFVRGYDTPTIATNGRPQPGEVKLMPGSCSPYSYFTAGIGPCLINVEAKVYFNGSTLVAATDRKVTASLNGGADFPLVTTDGLTYTSPIAIDRDALKGPLPITMKWEQTSGKVDMGGPTLETCRNNGSNNCKGALESGNTLQRSFVADQTASGPVRHVELIDSVTGLSPTNSVIRCTGGATTCVRSFYVRIGIKTLGADGPGDPPTVLRPGDSGGGSQHATVDCDADHSTGIVYELENQCSGASFVLNTGQACPTSNSGTPSPWPCVDVVTGTAANKIGKGMNKLILGDERATTCTVPNTWPKPVPDSKRVLPVFVVPLGAFDQSGSSYTVPVIRFVYFYVTGWAGQGGGFDNPCQLAGDDIVVDGSSIVGHYFTYIEPTSSGSSGEELCDFSAIDGCVAVMTK